MLPHLRYSMSQAELSNRIGRPAAKLRCRQAKVVLEVMTARGSSPGRREATEGRKKPRQNVCARGE